MKLTKIQKIKVLESAYEIIKKGEQEFVCCAVGMSIWSCGYSEKYVQAYNALRVIPELLEEKPADAEESHPWFLGGEVGLNQRLDLLIKVIEKIKAQ